MLAQLLKKLFEKIRANQAAATSGEVGVPLSVENQPLAELPPFGSTSLAHREQRSMLAHGGVSKTNLPLSYLVPRDLDKPVNLDPEAGWETMTKTWDSKHGEDYDYEYQDYDDLYNPYVFQHEEAGRLREEMPGRTARHEEKLADSEERYPQKLKESITRWDKKKLEAKQRYGPKGTVRNDPKMVKFLEGQAEDVKAYLTQQNKEVLEFLREDHPKRARQVNAMMEEKAQMLENLKYEDLEAFKERYPEVTKRTSKQLGGAIDEQMGALMPEEAPIPTDMGEEALEIPQESPEMMASDEDMEDDYLDFVISEALLPEEEQYLLNRLDEDDQLSEIFDKVVETASEFSGKGPVEGPGDAVSDSIPARLSDGEFVMTAKASNQIGPDVLDELMAVAEQEADGGPRQTAQTGGLAQTQGSAIIAGVSEDERGLAMKNKEAMRLLDPRLSLFAS